MPVYEISMSRLIQGRECVENGRNALLHTDIGRLRPQIRPDPTGTHVDHKDVLMTLSIPKFRREVNISVYQLTKTIRCDSVRIQVDTE
ncbi:hypothetical protein JTE90_014324 [Oedothorax gibbosus]|uniref:Uncharacterized protein n=1 Tax=Oedothorax gibbosus TaxID=931172 RepID=A0AAV6UXM0_9ARAC|nr:hypothetical protein JTE90_014324 [Oedothorax gibbosus]